MIKYNLLCLAQRPFMQNSMNFSHLIYWVIFLYLLKWSGTLVFGSAIIFPSFAKLGIPVRSNLFISGKTKEFFA